jgi:hypothetical protein
MLAWFRAIEVRCQRAPIVHAAVAELIVATGRPDKRFTLIALATTSRLLLLGHRQRGRAKTVAIAGRQPRFALRGTDSPGRRSSLSSCCVGAGLAMHSFTKG